MASSLLNKKGFELDLPKALLIVLAIAVILSSARFDLFSLVESEIGGRNADDAGAYHWGLESSSYTMESGSLFSVSFLDPANPPRTTDNSCCNLRIYGGPDSWKKLILIADLGTPDEKLIASNPVIDHTRQQGQEQVYVFMNVNSSLLSPGVHTLDVVFGNAYDPVARLGTGNAGFGERFGIQSYTGNNLAWARIQVNPAACFLDPNAEVLVSQVFTAGTTISKEGMKYPVQKFCDTNPANVLRSDTGGISQDYSIYYNLPYVVPPGFVVEVKYVALKTDVGIDFFCPSDSPTYSADQNQCVVTALIRPCGDTAILQVDGTCIEFPQTVCPGGTYYNASVSADNCIVDRCPAGSGWVDGITACGFQVPFDQLCSRGAYVYQEDKCTSAQGDFKPDYACPANSSLVETGDKDITGKIKPGTQVYYCQYGVSSYVYPECPEGTTEQEGSCVSTVVVEVDRVVVQTGTIDRGIPVAYKVESPGTFKLTPVTKKVLPITNIVLLVLAGMIGLAGFLYYLIRRRR